MKNMNFARQTKMDEPAPLSRPGGASVTEVESGEAALDRAWAHVVRSPRGVPEVDVAWLRAHASQVRLIDVREPDEWNGPLGHIDTAELVPLSQLAHAAATWGTDAPLAVICRSGGRSGMAALELERRGFRRVVSVAGGMLAWRQ